MITYKNFKTLMISIDHETIQEEMNKPHDYILMEVNITNAFGYATLTSADYSNELEEEAVSNGNLFIDKDSFHNLAVEYGCEYLFEEFDIRDFDITEFPWNRTGWSGPSQTAIFRYSSDKESFSDDDLICDTYYNAGDIDKVESINNALLIQKAPEILSYLIDYVNNDKDLVKEYALNAKKLINEIFNEKV